MIEKALEFLVSQIEWCAVNALKLSPCDWLFCWAMSRCTHPTDRLHNLIYLTCAASLKLYWHFFFLTGKVCYRSVVMSLFLQISFKFKQLTIQKFVFFWNLQQFNGFFKVILYFQQVALIILLRFITTNDWHPQGCLDLIQKDHVLRLWW